MEIMIAVASAVVAAVAAWIVCGRVKASEMEQSSALWKSRLENAEALAAGEKSRLESLRASDRENFERAQAADRERYESMLKSSSDSYEARLAAAGNNLLEARKNYESMLSEMKENNEKALAKQVEAIRAEMTSRTEELLKAREEELEKKAEETFKSITGMLGKDLDEMKKSFNDNRKAQTESSAALKEHLENAVRNLKEQTADIGSKADNLADALKGKNKMQGCFGEMFLENLLVAEGFREGIDYDREATLRDESGMVVLNEDSGKRMRPDVIIHFPDKTDVIVDSKMDLKAFSDWSSASDNAAKEDAAQRNLKSVRDQVDNLARKDYSSYISGGRKSLGYVLMYVPVYGALQLAKSLDPNIWRDAFRKNVLITTEETLAPFLRMIRTAWCNVEQVRNQQNIISAAEDMISRVYDLATGYAKIGKKMEELRTAYDACDRKLKDSGQSIIVSARKVISYGVKPRAGKSDFPALYGSEASSGAALNAVPDASDTTSGSTTVMPNQSTN